MTTFLMRTAAGAVALMTMASMAQAHPAGGTADLAHGLGHVLSDPLHLLSLAGIGASLVAAVVLLRRIARRANRAHDRS